MCRLVVKRIACIGVFVGFLPLHNIAYSAELSVLAPGQRIAVTGKHLSDGFFLGKRVVLKSADATAVVQSKISSIHTDAHRLSMLGLSVLMKDTTEIVSEREQPISWTELQVGNWVRIEGERISKKTLLALKITLIDELPNNLEIIEGEIQRLTNGERFACLVLDTPIVFEESVRLTDFREKGRGLHSIKRDDDDQQAAPINIGNFLILGGKVEVEVEPQKNLALDGGEEEMGSHFSFKPELSINFNPDVEGYAKLKLKRKPLIRTGAGDQNASTVLDVSEMYLTYYGLFHTPWRLQFGRQRFKDKREWLFDENLDAIRLILDTKRLDMQFGLVHGGVFLQDDLDDEMSQYHYYASARVKLARRTYLGGFIFGRKHFHENIVLNWYGAQVRGQFFKIIRYWSNIALVNGTDEVNSVHGFGYDFGMRISTHSVKPFSLTLGYAYGSGDDDLDDKSDSNFRQTGLQDNSAKLGGLKRIKYYGELFEPELSNMQILTLGVGVRPTLHSSVEFIFHSYHQEVAQSFLRDSDLDAEPLGRNRDLGKELDFIFTLREIRNLDITFNLGYFRTGPAFGKTPKNVFLGKIKMQIFY
ncbi:MAG: alginate export family protein [bacterium]